MKKLLASTLILQMVLAGMPVPQARAAGFGISSVDDCKEKTKVNLSTPKTAEDKVDQDCGGSNSCKTAIRKMWSIHRNYSSGSTEMCTQIFNSGSQASGQGSHSFTESGGIRTAASKKLKELSEKQERDLQQLKTTREQLYREAQQNVPASQRQAVTRAVSEHKRLSNISMDEVERRNQSLSQLQAPDRTKAALKAATQVAAFQTSLQNEKTQNSQRATELDGSVKDLNGRADNSSSVSGDKDGKGFSFNDLAPWAGVAVAGLGALAAMQNKKSASSDLDSAAAQNPYGATTTPSISDTPAALAPADVGETGTGTGSSGGGGTPTFSTDGNSRTPAASFQQDSAPIANISPPPAASSAEGNDGLPSQFNGALGGSPFSGSATSGPGGATAGGSFGSGGAGTSADSLGQSAGGKGKVGDENVIQAGGGIPGFAGSTGSSGSSSGTTEPSLKDLFKAGDPFAAGGALPGGDGTVAGAIEGAGLFDADGNLTADAAGGGAGDQSGMIPGANDSRTLFVRVHDYHQRCQKKGCVTSEAGGKI